jgi:hypothetical protein
MRARECPQRLQGQVESDSRQRHVNVARAPSRLASERNCGYDGVVRAIRQ